MDEDEPPPVELGDVLDLHTFQPRDVKDLVVDYLDDCVARGFTEVRIIHGKGVGTLRTIVHAALDRHPGVVSYRLADGHRGGWGATIVTLSPGSGGAASSSTGTTLPRR